MASSGTLPLACGGKGADTTGTQAGSYSAERVQAAFQHAGMEAVKSSQSTDRLTDRFTQDGLSFVDAAIKDPSGTVIYRYQVIATVFPSEVAARAAMPGATRERAYLVRRFRNVVVAVTGLSFRPKSLPPGVTAAMERLSTGAE